MGIVALIVFALMNVHVFCMEHYGHKSTDDFDLWGGYR